MDARADKPIRRILLSNDDGVDAIGLKILYDIATQFSDDVWVIAPSENRSGASRSITLRRDVVIQQIGPKRYSCSGTPADCIIFGMSQILDQPPDLVLTGINHGMNVADDILYSGTVAGAMEAALLQCQPLPCHSAMAVMILPIMPRVSALVLPLSGIFWMLAFLNG